MMRSVSVSRLNPGDQVYWNTKNLTGFVLDKYDKYTAFVFFPGWTGGHSCNGRLTGPDANSGWMISGVLYQDDDWQSAPDITPEVFDNMF